MSAIAEQVRIRSLSELDIALIIAIDERLTGVYRPDVWERRVMYYLRRDPDASQVAELGGKQVGFMLSDLRGGEFGLEETSGWIERFGVDPDYRGKGVGRKLFAALTEHFKAAGAHTLRTFVDNRQKDNAAFLEAVGFEPGNLTAPEMGMGGRG